jgi:AraC family transcriptional regulator
MPNTVNDTIFIKNMLCSCCIKVITTEFAKNGIHILAIELGKASITYDAEKVNHNTIRNILEKNNFALISDRETILVEQIKNAVIELVHYSNNINSIIRKSDYLIERLNMSYQTISKLFSHHEKITLEKFIILHKIERTKELILCQEYTLSEIAYMMDFSSVQHLSNTFRKTTGISVTDYKKKGNVQKIPLDKLY